MKRLCLFIVASVFALTSAVRAESKAFFPLGIWYEGGVGDARDNVLPEDPEKAAPIYDQNFADIAAHGVNLIVVPNSPPKHHKIVLDAAQKHGLKVILELGLDGGPFGRMIRGQREMDEAIIQKTLDHVYKPIKDHPALLRVQLLDEPAGDTFDRYAHIADALRKYDASAKPFCCLTAGSDCNGFLKTTRSDVVAFDSYPIGPTVKEGDAAPLHGFADLSQRFADQAVQNHAQSWAVVQAFDMTGALRFPTDAEMRCMTWSAIANGNKGVFWFLYQSEAVGQAMMNGVVDRQFKSRPIWDEVTRLTKELAPLTPILADLHDEKEIKQSDPVLMAREYTDSSGQAYAIVVNFDTLASHDIDLGRGSGKQTLTPGGGALVKLDKAP